MNLPEKLVQLRKEKGLTQLKLAELMNISRQAVSRWEVGDAVPSTENLKCLSDLYGVPLDYLLYDNIQKPDGKEERPKETAEKDGGTNSKNRGKRILLAAIALGVSAMLLIICSGIFGTQRENTYSMDELEGEVIGEIPREEFNLEW